MCRQVTCKTCDRPTWAGCGAHVDQVLGHVPPAQRCRCGSSPKPAASPGEPRQSRFGRLLGRRSAAV
ncbi:MAG TPA: hypothetical protein VIW24_05160 [Aldersonia sp.]